MTMVCADTLVDGKAAEIQVEEDAENSKEEGNGEAENSENTTKRLSSGSWNSAWYESFLAFEAKQRERKDENHIDSDELFDRIMAVEEGLESNDEGVVMPAAVLGQLEVVKLQMNEYNAMLDEFERTMLKNEQLKKKVESMKNSESDLRKQYNTKMTKQEERIKKISAQFSNAKIETEKLAKKLAIHKRNEEMQKRAMAKELAELKLLRQLHHYEKKEGGEVDKSLRLSDSAVPSSKSSAGSKDVWDAVSNAVKTGAPNAADVDDNASIGASSIGDNSATRENKKNILKLLIRNLQHEEGDDKKVDEDGSIISKNKLRPKPRGSVSSQEWDPQQNAPYSKSRKNNNSKGGFFKSVLTTLYDEGEDNSTVTSKTDAAS